MNAETGGQVPAGARVFKIRAKSSQALIPIDALGACPLHPDDSVCPGIECEVQQTQMGPRREREILSPLRQGLVSPPKDAAVVAGILAGSAQCRG